MASSSTFFVNKNKKYGRLQPLYSIKKQVGIKRKIFREFWYCQCDCGNITLVDKYKLCSGETQSCGCLQKERTSQASKKYNTYIFDDECCYIYCEDKNYPIIIDKEDYDKIKGLYWQNSLGGKPPKGRPAHKNKDGSVIFIYHYILGIKDIHNQVVDHINRNYLDNRKENLRLVTVKENSKNHLAKNFSYSKLQNKFEVTLGLDYTTLHLGFFDSITQAHIHAHNMRIKYYGEYAWDYNLNPYESFIELEKHNKLKNLTKEEIQDVKKNLSAYHRDG